MEKGKCSKFTFLHKVVLTFMYIALYNTNSIISDYYKYHYMKYFNQNLKLTEILL